MVNVVAKKLQALLVAANMTQRELAACAKLDQSRICRLLKTGGSVRTTTALRLATALGKTPAAFMAAVSPRPEDFFGV